MKKLLIISWLMVLMLVNVMTTVSAYYSNYPSSHRFSWRNFNWFNHWQNDWQNNWQGTYWSRHANKDCNDVDLPEVLRDKCCETKMKDEYHIACLGNWQYNDETKQCAWVCDVELISVPLS